MRSTLLALWATALSLMTPNALALEIYRYVNDKGVVVIDRQGVPPEFIAGGYEVLNEQGRVLRVVPPAPSLAERKRLLEQQAQAKADLQLLRLYSTPADVDRARERTLKEHDNAIEKAKSHLASLNLQQANVQRQAAEHERAGRKVPQNLLEQLNDNNRQQLSIQAQITRLERERLQEQAFYDDQKQRIERLLKH